MCYGAYSVASGGGLTLTLISVASGGGSLTEEDSCMLQSVQEVNHAMAYAISANYPVHGAWCMVHGAWCMVYEISANYPVQPAENEAIPALCQLPSVGDSIAVCLGVCTEARRLTSAKQITGVMLSSL